MKPGSLGTRLARTHSGAILTNSVSYPDFVCNLFPTVSCVVIRSDLDLCLDSVPYAHTYVCVPAGSQRRLATCASVSLTAHWTCTHVGADNVTLYPCNSFLLHKLALLQRPSVAPHLHGNIRTYVICNFPNVGC